MTAFPPDLAAGGGVAQRYRRRRDLMAIHGPVPPPWRAAAVGTLEAEGITLCRVPEGQEVEEALAGRVTAVYSLGPEGPPAAPGGEVFVRFAEPTRAADRTADLAAAGYEVSKTLPWAPQAVWVRARSGGIADALANLSRLEAIPGVVRVEPQMLGLRAQR